MSARKTIVVMDDSDIVLEALAAALGARGYDVRTAATLAELEGHTSSCRPDLYVLDVQMPEAFGDDVGVVLREVRRVGAPILLFSSLKEESLAVRARDAGLAGYVTKEAGVPALLARIDALLSGASRS